MLLGIQIYASRIVARLYDRLMAPLERRAVGRWRERTWVEVPSRGLGLEVGAGTGANFDHHPAGARVIAMDRSLEMLQRARKRLDGSGVALVVADAEALPFRAGTFDWAAETLVFCEVGDPERGFREMARVVRPGGPLILLEHVRPSGWLGGVADVLTALTAPLWGEHFNRDAADSIRAAGLSILREEWLWRDTVTLLVACSPPLDPRPGRSRQG